MTAARIGSRTVASSRSDTAATSRSSTGRPATATTPRSRWLSSGSEAIWPAERLGQRPRERAGAAAALDADELLDEERVPAGAGVDPLRPAPSSAMDPRIVAT